MLKYTDTQITFSEIPSEITLCINLSNCPHRCPGCHSPELQKDIGEELTLGSIRKLIDRNQGISTVCFMGGEKDYPLFEVIANFIKQLYPKLKVGIYWGCNEIPKNFNYRYIDYIKLGPYVEELGGLNSPTTNQRMYQNIDNELVDITNKFWK